MPILSYNVLLGHPWVHTHGIIGSTLHQCFKFCDEDGNVKRVYTNPNPFMGEEVNYLDANFKQQPCLSIYPKNKDIEEEG